MGQAGGVVPTDGFPWLRAGYAFWFGEWSLCSLADTSE